MRPLAWIALTGLLLQPAAAVVCEARCLTTAAPRETAAAPSCHEASGPADGSRLRVAAGLDPCAHAERVEPASATLLRGLLTVVALPHTRPTPVAPAPTILTTPARASIRHRAPDDSSGTLRV
jgi:hypothetical protein